MKRLYTLLIACTCFSFAGLSQFEFYVQGDPTNTNYASGTYTYQALNISSENAIYIDVVNNTGGNETYVVGRRRILPEAASWEDGFCWEGSSGFGICIPPGVMNQEYFQMTNNDVPITPGQAGELKPQIYPEMADVGYFKYRYYVGTLTNNKMDSMDLEVFITPLSVPEPKLTVGIHPNPASSYIQVEADGYKSADIEVVDVLGNLVYTSTLSESTKIDVAEFRNGIYFVTVSAEGTRVSRKVIVRH